MIKSWKVVLRMLSNEERINSNFVVIGRITNEQEFADRRDGLALLTFEEARKLVPGEKVISAINDPIHHHYTLGSEYIVLGMHVDISSDVVAFKTTNDNTKYANGKIIEIGNYFTITFHHNLGSPK